MGQSLRTVNQRDVEQKLPRGRPRDVEKTNAILNAAIDLFLEQGFDGTSMDEVARRAGVSKQTVYSHFSSKEQLFGESVHSEIAAHYPDRALESVETHTLQADLTAVCMRLATLLMSERAFAMFRLLVTAAPRGSALADIFWRSGPADVQVQLGHFLQTWVDRGALKIDDTEKAGHQLVALFKEPSHFKVSIGIEVPPTEEEIKLQVNEAVQSFLKLYAA